MPRPAARRRTARIKARYRRPDNIPFPADNAYTDAKAVLGQTLFFDPRLSGPGTMSCATCHNSALGWKDGLPVGVGHDAKKLGRATPTVLNLAWAGLLTWDGRKDGLEDQAMDPLNSAAGMNLPPAEMARRLQEVPGYRRLFQQAFGTDAVTP